MSKEKIFFIACKVRVSINEYKYTHFLGVTQRAYIIKIPLDHKEPSGVVISSESLWRSLLLCSQLQNNALKITIQCEVDTVLHQETTTYHLAIDCNLTLRILYVNLANHVLAVWIQSSHLVWSLPLILDEVAAEEEEYSAILLWSIVHERNVWTLLIW